MEHIDFNYVFSDDDKEEKSIHVGKCNEDGLHDYEVCEMFLDFMRSIGFSEENIYKYFQE